jgi:hypothetical protein
LKGCDDVYEIEKFWNVPFGASGTIFTEGSLKVGFGEIND